MEIEQQEGRGTRLLMEVNDEEALFIRHPDGRQVAIEIAVFDTQLQIHVSRPAHMVDTAHSLRLDYITPPSEKGIGGQIPTTR